VLFGLEGCARVEPIEVEEGFRFSLKFKGSGLVCETLFYAKLESGPFIEGLTGNYHLVEFGCELAQLVRDLSRAVSTRR
jgi:hypothetical protein